MPEGTGSVHRFPDYLPGSWVTAISTNKPVSVSITMWALNSLKSVKTVIKIRGARDWHNPCVQGSDSPAFKHILTSKSNFVDLKELCRYFFCITGTELLNRKLYSSIGDISFAFRRTSDQSWAFFQNSAEFLSTGTNYFPSDIGVNEALQTKYQRQGPCPKWWQLMMKGCKKRQSSASHSPLIPPLLRHWVNVQL